MKDIGIRKLLCALCGFIGFMIVFGTAGALDNNTITLGRGIKQIAIGLLLLALFAMLGGIKMSNRTGIINRINGKIFEKYIEKTLAFYKQYGMAAIEKTPEPMRPTQNVGSGKYIAFFEKKAQPDYKGTIKGGKAIMFEAKYTTTYKMEQSRVTKNQAESLTLHKNLGALCFVVAGFRTGNVYRIPWTTWQNMKEIYGRKYVTEADLAEFRLKKMKNGVLIMFEDLKGTVNL